MSEGYQTEEEQIEAFKKWWKENGTSTIVGIALSLAAVFGWQGWQKQQLEASYTASATYQNLILIANQDMAQLSEEQVSTAKHLAETLKTDFNSSSYALFAAFYKAKFAVAANDLEAAELELRWVLAKSPSAEIDAQARLRLSRVLSAKQQYDEALSLVSGEALAYAALFDEQRGDVYLALGKSDDARLAYNKAKETNQLSEKPVNNALLELKLQQLKIAEEA
jgi:predicted negative regulator of RcsB-dependent stress response